jgi:hypothetical protein
VDGGVKNGGFGHPPGDIGFEGDLVVVAGIVGFAGNFVHAGIMLDEV